MLLSMFCCSEGKATQEDIGPKQTELEEIYYLKQLELKVGNFPFTTKIISRFIAPGTKSSGNEIAKDLIEQDQELLNWIKESSGDIFVKAAKHQNEIMLDFLINCGVDINFMDEDFHSAADYAWRNKNYKILLALLEMDSFFPTGFSVSELKEDNDNRRNIRNLVDERNRLHEVVKTGEVEDVKSLNLVGLKLYLNTDNESIVYTALKHKKYVTYAYLKSVGAELAKSVEKFELDRLSLMEKVALQEAMIQYFPSVSNSHIYFLISKTRSQKPVKNLTEITMNYYRKLDRVAEISIILKTIQYADYLDIIFDFDEDEILKVNPTAPDYSRGEAKYKDGRIYIASGSNRQEKEILGTLAHELTHMVMHMLFKNDCNPYGKSDKASVIFFREFKRRIRKYIKNDPLNPSKILLDGLHNYYEDDHDAELIVRIPHILAQYSDGREWLDANVPEFFGFYTKVIQRKCEEYVKGSVVLKPKNTIRSINESVGEITKLKECEIFFKNFTEIKHVLKSDNKIFLYKVKNTFLGVLKILQGIFGKEYSNSHNFLVLKFKNFVTRIREILEAFYSEASNVMILEMDNDPTDYELCEASDMISLLLEEKPNKKIVFVTLKNSTKSIIKNLDELAAFSEEIPDDDFSLDHLGRESQKKILRKRVKFQGKWTILNDLIQHEDLYKIITSVLLTDLIENKSVAIGNEIPDLSSLDGSYSDIILDINFDSLIREVKNSEDIFILRSSSKNELNKHLDDYFEKAWINGEHLTSETYNFEKKIMHEKIVLVNSRFQNKDFRNFCKNNSRRKCYLIDVKNINEISFVLQQIYNPNFYMKRNIKKIQITSDQMKKLVTENGSETFIIISTINHDIADYTNVKCLSKEEANDVFRMLAKSDGRVHQFEMENGMFTWKNSHGSVANLRKFVHNENPGEDDSKNKPGLLQEEKFILELFARKVVLIADDPGMGKSTIITTLYGSKLFADTHWIIRINLKDHLKAIKENIDGKELNVEKIVRFLQEIEPILKTEHNEYLLNVILTSDNKFSRCLLIVFDGFDEILDEEDRDNIITFFKFLKHQTFSKIWITSRLQYKSDLERELETFAIELDPFDEEMKKKFVKKYLKDRLNLILKGEFFRDVFAEGEKSEISGFTKQLLLKMKEIFLKDVTKFVGTPLQLNLIMLGSLEYFQAWAEGKKELKFDYLGKDLLEVYENFIEKKYEIYFRKLNILEKKLQRREVKQSEKYNKELAESLVYKRKTIKPEDDDKELILLMGLIQSQNDESFEFIHFTFREYYFAKSFSEHVLGEHVTSDFYEKMTFLLEEIFVKREYEMIRNFLNILLKKKLTEGKLEKFKIFYDHILKSYSTRNSVLAISAQNGYENIFNFIYSIYCNIASGVPSFKTTNILNQTIFSMSAIGGKLQIWNVLFEILINLKNKNRDWENSYFKILICESIHLATERNNWQLTQFLLEKLEEIFSGKELEFYLTALNETYKVFYKIILSCGSSAMLELILKIGGKYLSKEKQYEYFVSTASCHGPTSIFAAATKQDPRFMELLLEKCENIMMPQEERRLLMKRDNSEGTIFHKAARYGKLEICKVILEKIEMLFDSKDQEDFLMSENTRCWTALAMAIHYNHTEIVALLIEKAEKILNPERFVQFLLMKNTLSQIFRQLYMNFDSFEILFRKMEKILPEEDKRRWLMMPDNFHGSLFNNACYYGDLKLMNFVLGKLKNILGKEDLKGLLMTRDDRNYTCLHLATRKGRIGFVKFLFHEIQKILPPDEQQELITIRNSDGRTILHLGAFQKDMDILNFFLEKTEEISPPGKHWEFVMAKDNDAVTFFHLVPREFPVEFIESLMEKYEKSHPSNYFQLLNGDKLLHDVLWNKDPDVSKLLFKKMDEMLDSETQRKLLMTTDKDNQTCLHLAARRNQKEFMKLFFLKMEEILTPEEQCELLFKENIPQGNTVLHDAICNEEPDLLKLLFDMTSRLLSIEKQQEFLTAMNNNKETALNKIAFGNHSGKLNSVKLILEKAEAVLTNHQHRIFLLHCLTFQSNIFEMFAGSKGSDLLKLFLEKIEKVLDIRDIESLLTEQLHRSNFSNMILHAAAFEGNAEILKILLEYIEKIFPPEKQGEILMEKNEENQTVLHAILSSTESIQYEAVKLLLKKLEKLLTPKDLTRLFTVKDNIFGGVLHAAALTKPLNVIKLLFDEGEKILKKDFCQAFMMKDEALGSVLHAATLSREYEVMDFILNQAKRLLPSTTLQDFLMITDKNNRTVLHLAVGKEEPELDHEIKIGTAQIKDQHLDELNDKSEFVNLFLREGKKILGKEKQRRFLAMKDKSDRTALQLAAECGELEAVKLLLQQAEKCLFGEDLEKFLIGRDPKNATILKTNNSMIKTLITTFVGEKII